MTASPAPTRFCPHCDYSLEGLPHGATLCPECGGSLSARAHALAEARRLSRSLVARVVLLASPGIGIVGGFFIFIIIRRAFFDWLGFIFLALWIGGATAAYFARPRRLRNLSRAILIGLPIGLLYFLAITAIAAAIILIISLLPRLPLRH